MAFNDCQLDHVLAWIVDEVTRRVPLDLGHALAGDDAARQDVDHVDPVFLQIQPQAVDREIFDMDAASDRRNIRPLDRRQIDAVLSCQIAVNEDIAGLEVGQIIDQGDIGPPAGEDAAAVFETEGLCRVQGGHLDRRHGIDPEFDSPPQVVIQVTFLQDGPGLAVIRTQQTAAGIAGGHKRQEIFQVMTGRTLPHEDIEAVLQTLVHLLPG